MSCNEQTAREQIVAAGHELVKHGLVARTWGNISARISDTHFLITPSGLAYETLRPEQLVLVRIADCSYEGAIKPSSEKGIHAAAYARNPEVGFVIHTHQDYASCMGISGAPLEGLDHPLLGTCVPCAAYGMPSTKKLQQGVESAMARYPEAPAILMRQHGALCMGKDFGQAFHVAQALEDVSRHIYHSTVRCPEETGSSIDTLLLQLQTAAPDTYFCAEASPAVLAVAAQGRTLHPHLDDLAQIAGVTIRCTDPDPAAVLRALRGRDAVLVPGIGAICRGRDRQDLGAVAAIVRKSAMASLYADLCGAKPLSILDRMIMRTVYTMKYAKQKGRGGAKC